MIIPNTDSSGKIIQRISDTSGKLHMPAMPAGTGCRSLMQRFYALQAERVEAYRLFEEGHEAYLRTAPHYDFQRYRQLVHEITLAFSGISKELIEMKERLHEECERPDLSEHIEKLQEKERHKLELTAKLQLAKQNVVDHPEDESGPELVQELRQKIIKTVEAISEILQDFKYDSEELA